MLPENDLGNIEYKYRLDDSDNEKRIIELTTQMKFRLSEGDGIAIYYLGVEDNGNTKGLSMNDLVNSKNVLQKVILDAEATIMKSEDIEVDNSSEIKYISCIELISNHSTKSIKDIKMVVAGNVDVGKSTTIGVITTGKLDNGRGLARTCTFAHRHEIESGRTSSISHHILGFDSDNEPVGHNSVRKLTWKEIVEKSSKLISFTDLAGHEKYLRTTIFGISSTKPDYALIIIGSNMGITKMTKEHMGVCVLLDIPFIILMTKVDIAPPHVYEEIQIQLKRILKGSGMGKIPYYIKNSLDIVTGVEGLKSETLVPVLELSNVTGVGLDLVLSTLSQLKPRVDYEKDKLEPVEYYIDGHYNITGVGTVVSGILLKGNVKPNDHLLLGPDSLGGYRKLQIKSIHNKRVPVINAEAGEYVCFALKKIPRTFVKRGMVIISDNHKLRSSWEFYADIEVVNSHHTTIKIGYQSLLHIHNIRQSASVLQIIKKSDSPKDNEEKKYIRSKDRAKVHYKFSNRPAFIKEGDKFIFREGNVRGVGIITQILN